ncbi:TatD family hydrolase [Treponema sp. OMZ 840]|uniref:TatD family hydrolase n=1 Tax=Treponema sp. OMZ 840 TaxID=244313 RepID=UPI003D8F793A
MFTDTHCHLTYLAGRGIDAASVIRELADKKVPFVLDSGTRSNDLKERIDFVNGITASVQDSSLKERAASMLRFGAGIWPDKDAIADRFLHMDVLREQIELCDEKRLCAIGECGFDRHWNTDDADEEGERELFDMQLELARELELPLIVHSRDAFEQTLAGIKNAGEKKGVLHCYSYGAEEARAFLDEGWYISLSGSVTYAKKTQISETEKLVRFIPADRLLLETDAPYLAPVPFRGKPNTPLLIEHTYRFVANIRGLSTEELAAAVLQNARRLFG